MKLFHAFLLIVMIPFIFHGFILVVLIPFHKKKIHDFTLVVMIPFYHDFFHGFNPCCHDSINFLRYHLHSTIPSLVQSCTPKIFPFIKFLSLYF
jgi:hypothetical protein